MSLIESSVTSPELDLNAIKDLPLYEELTLADINDDSSLSYSEMVTQGITELPTPLYEDTFIVRDDLDWSVYVALVWSAINTRFALSISQHDITEEDSAEGWIQEDAVDLMGEISLSTHYNCAFEIIACKEVSNGYRLLMKYNDPETAYGDYFFTVGLNEDAHFDDFELGGAVFLFSEKINNLKLIALKALLLKDLHVLLTTTPHVDPLTEVDDDIQEEHYEFLEAKMIEANPDMIHLYQSSAATPTEEPNAKMKKRIAHSKENLMPIRLSLTGNALNTCYALDCRSELPLNSDEIKCLSEVVDSLPETLVESLMRQGQITHNDLSLSIEIMENDLFVATGYPWAGAYYNANLNKISVRRDQLSCDVVTLSRLFIHEFSHAIPIANHKDANFFVHTHWNNARQELNQGHHEFNRCVTPYALNTHFEMFAESTVAYFADEDDLDPWYTPNKGPCSRAELRKKQPELYLALCLFYDEDSPLLGDLSCFDSHSQKIYTAMLNDAFADYLLEPQRSIEEIYGLYEKYI
jgi:hypothetical protein